MFLTTAILLLSTSQTLVFCLQAHEAPILPDPHSIHSRAEQVDIRDSVLKKVLPVLPDEGLRKQPQKTPYHGSDPTTAAITDEDGGVYFPYYGQLKPSRCTGSRKAMHRRALQRARQRALVAADAIRRPDEYQLYLRELYFNTTDPKSISFVHQKFLFMAAAAAATVEATGPEEVPHFCYDLMERCPSKPWIYASTITIPGPPTNTSIQYCDRYFDLPADDCSRVQNQWSVTLHELSHAVHWHKPATKDLTYDINSCTEFLTPNQQIVNAQNYQLFAKDVWCSLQKSVGSST